MHKTLIHQSIAQRHYKNLQYKTGEKDRTSYWASIHKKGEVSKKVSSKPCKWGDVAGDGQTCGWSESQGCMMLSVCAFVEGEPYLSWMQFFQAHSCLYSFIFFLFKGWPEDTALALWPEMTALPTSTFTEMRRLACDETPIPLAMQPKVTAVAW